MKILHITALLILLLLPSCKQNTSAKQNTPTDIISSNADTTVSPANDFFSFANGSWVKNNPIPPEETSWGIGNLVVNDIQSKLKTICEELSTQSAETGSSGQMVGDFWKTAMDSVKCDKLGILPLETILSEIDAINDLRGLSKVIGELQSIGVSALFDMYIAQDDKNSDKMALYLYQGGIGLPDRDYFFREDARTKSILEEYPHHIERMLQLLSHPVSVAKDQSEKIVALETILAHSSRKLEDLRDPYANYTKMSISALNKLSPSIDWKSILQIWGAENLDTVIVGQPEFLKTADHLFANTPMVVWKSYLKWKLMNAFAPTLNSGADQENFAFYGKIIRGAQIQKPRWKRSLNVLEVSLGDQLGKEFVKNYFGETEKKRYSDLVEAIRQEMESHIQKLDWMSPQTKEKALIKLKTMSKKVGYPDRWKNYEGMKISNNSFCENVIQARQWNFKDEIKKLFKPVDRTEWGMTPQTYNAYYNPSNNEIVLPAAIFIVPGTKDSALDDATVYGYAAASTIGHEMTHGFDDTGRQYDEKGNLHNWWTAEDERQFNLKAKKLVNQFNDFVVLDSLKVNGQATLGENIADLGGVVLGLDAFKKTKQFQEGKSIGGFTPIQRYFMGYALGWLSHTRPESLADQIMTDVHSPALLRVNGPMANIPEFYEAFHLKASDKMYRADSLRVSIW